MKERGKDGKMINLLKRWLHQKWRNIYKYIYWYVDYPGPACAHQTMSLQPEQAFRNRFIPYSPWPKSFVVEGTWTWDLGGSKLPSHRPHAPGQTLGVKNEGKYWRSSYQVRWNILAQRFLSLESEVEGELPPLFDEYSDNGCLIVGNISVHTSIDSANNISNNYMTLLLMIFFFVTTDNMICWLIFHYLKQWILRC